MSDAENFFDSEKKIIKPIVKPSLQENIVQQDFVTKYLKENNLITNNQLKSAIRIFKKENKGKMFGEVLVELDIITSKMLKNILHSLKGISQFNLKQAMIDNEVIDKIPHTFAIQNKIIPISYTGEVLYVAIQDVYDIMRIDKTRRYFPSVQRIIPVYASEADIMLAIDKYYGYEMSIDNIVKEIVDEDISNNSSITSTNASQYKHPIVRLIDAFLTDAVKIGASDVHFEPCDFFLRVRYRIDGSMIQRYNLDKDIWDAMIVRIKVISGLDIAEKRHTQDGRISISVSARNIDLRISVQPTIHGENCVMRILDPSTVITNINKLGIDKFNVKLLKNALIRPEGIIIITGPTGSGKTTTLYSLISEINTLEVNIMSMEEPVEYKLPIARQSNISEDGSGMHFDEALRGAMRQDPDIIFIGEVRDETTARLAIRAAMTGHKVFTSLHTNNALSAVSRLRELGAETSNIANSLTCVAGQRLVRTLCIHCKKRTKLLNSDKKILGIDLNDNPLVYKRNPLGCEHCNLGYKGRTLVLEVIFIDEELRKMIAKNATYDTIHAYLKNSDKFISMKKSAIQKLLLGDTDIIELKKKINIAEDELYNIDVKKTAKKKRKISSKKS
ncbi:Type II/IV secretion system protein [Candidatus Xenohaliotis californiensis]|uniref:Type II/IV secretion system protein n=1 Tax=Candidatus Xenohaliotis californiensis TaxID=84677 RepID=A0ABM9N724_9RICK|nr:Type II/IV secretion system protein [Candidatus Xenohaliotis californiensis]